MTGDKRTTRVPGRYLIALASRLGDGEALRALLLPVVADLQEEVRAAGTNRRRRALAHARGWVAFWKVVFLSPLVLPGAPAGSRLVALAYGRHGGRAIALLVVGLCAAIWPMFGWFIAAVMVGGGTLAVVLHWWHDRHPSVLAPAEPLASLHRPEINLSSIPVAGDIGGLFFVVGSLVIVLTGLPPVRWFVLGAAVAGTLTAHLIFRWRSSHQSGPRSILGG